RSVSYLESTFYMRNQLLRDSDIFSSACSVELRVPFLDLDVLQLAWSLPAAYHRTVRTGGKRMLKDLLKRLQPGFDTRRKKMGFTLPWKYWLRDKRLASAISDLIHSAPLYAALPVTPAEGRDLLRRFLQRDPRVSWAQVWSLVVLLAWTG